MTSTDNLIERLAVLDLRIEVLQKRMAAIQPARRHPPEWQQTPDRLADARRASSVRMTQLDSFKWPWSMRSGCVSTR